MEVYNCSDITLCDLPIEVARGKALTEQFHTVHLNFDAAPAAVTSLVPPYVRKTRTLEAALPWLYLKGVSSGEMGSALKVLLGHDAKGLSANTVSRLKRDWVKEYDGWRGGPLDVDSWVYIWVDGVYSGLRGEDGKLCALVIVGVNARGQKQFPAIENGVRELYPELA